MVVVNFKNVGQGDSIIIEWADKIGIIDCNLYENRNPVLDYISNKSITEIEFIVLSHFHFDHFSGMPELFKYCFEKNIKINWFFHTLAECVLQIYNKIIVRKKIEKASSEFFKYLEILDKNVINDLHVNHKTSIELSNTMKMSFLAPIEQTGINIAKQIKRKINTKQFTYFDINKLSTVTYIENESESILLTSDAVKNSFKHLQKKINKNVALVQIPHHGSFLNIHKDFWQQLNKKDNCPGVFSVGFKPTDKLPNRETVEFIDSLGFNIHSTNSVYGINEYFNFDSNNHLMNNSKTKYLNYFSKRLRIVYTDKNSNTKYNGDQRFVL